VLGSEVVSADREGARVVAVRAHAAGRDIRYVAPSFVLATGGFGSGGIEVDSRWATRERVLGLPLRGVPADGEPRFVRRYLDEQPMARVGVAVDADLRAEGAENVVVAGAALPGAIPWREGSGEGIALASGYRAAGVVLAEHSAAKATA
jgi:glycerol-3-phosphate dehydrogenase subunit B